MKVIIAFAAPEAELRLKLGKRQETVDTLRCIQQNIEKANEIWKLWVNTGWGSFVVAEAASGIVETEAEKLQELPSIRDQYGKLLESNVCAGVGMTVDEADKALSVARKRGQNAIVLYTDQIRDELKPEEKDLAKAIPDGAGGGFSRPQAPKAPSKNDQQSAGNQMPDVASLEDKFHAHAQKQLQQEPLPEPANDKIRSQVVTVLQQLRDMTPALEQLQQKSPESYQALVDLTRVVVSMAREMPSGNKTSQSPKTVADVEVGAIRKSEGEIYYHDNDHTLPGSFGREGYELKIHHSPHHVVGVIHRGGHVLGRVTAEGNGLREEWLEGRPRHGIDLAAKLVLDGHMAGRVIADEWSHPTPGSPFELVSTQPPMQKAESPVNGADVTSFHHTYAEAATAKPKGQGGADKNIWVRQSAEPGNSNRTLMVQMASDLLQTAPRSHADDYYDKLYQNRQGYHRPADFWEIPQWQAHMAHSMPNADSYVVRDPEEAKAFLKNAGYKNVCFSALDVNRDHVKDIAKAYGGKVVVGGYTDMNHFADVSNIQTFPSIKSFVESEGETYRPGYDYRHFRGTQTIPRLTLSDGCLHRCSFCSVPKQLQEKSRDEVMQQVDAFARHLPSDLVYLNDKTFGQAPNHTLLPEIYQRLKQANPNFRGFVVQTTAAQMRKMTPEFLKNSGIQHVELGIESVNDDILRAHKKPATVGMIEEAAQKLRAAGISLIPNIMIGLPGENEATYKNTMDWLQKNRDIISHVNAYNLALYDDSELGQKIGALSEADRNENVIGKSFHTNPQVHKDFHRKLFEFANGQLDQGLMKAELSKNDSYRQFRDAIVAKFKAKADRIKELTDNTSAVAWKKDDGSSVVVCPNTHPTSPYRVSYIDAEGNPAGHIEAQNYEEALKAASQAVNIHAQPYRTLKKGEDLHPILFKAEVLGGKKRDPKDFNPEDLEEGIQEELEHTDDREIAAQIAMDHLAEDPQYYKKLKQMMKTTFAPGVGNLPEARAPHKRPHVVLPVGSAKHAGPQSTRDVGKIKTQGADGKTKWREVRAGQILGPDGAPRSSLNPTGK